MSAQPTFEEQLEWGRSKEMELRAHLAMRGHHVVLVNPDDEKQSPKVHLPGGKVIPAADLLCIAPDGKSFWVEVKAKSVPNYYYKEGCFKHGVDLRLWKCYAQLAERAPVYIAICEMMSPPSDDFKAPWCGGDWDHYRQFLVPGPQWLYVKLEDTIECGQRSKGSRNKDLWVWPRSIMKRFM